MSYCRECGSKLNAGDRFCHDCGTEVGAGERPGRTGTPPPSGGDGQGHRREAMFEDQASRADQPVLAGLGSRFVALIVDTIVMFILFWLIGSKIAVRTGGVTDGGFALEGGPALLAMLLTLIAALLYFSVLESFWNGQTLGKKLMGIQVVTLSGAPCSFMKALMRNIVRIVDAFGFYIVGVIAILMSGRNQRLGDMAAGTLVVKTS